MERISPGMKSTTDSSASSCERIVGSFSRWTLNGGNSND